MVHLNIQWSGPLNLRSIIYLFFSEKIIFIKNKNTVRVETLTTGSDQQETMPVKYKMTGNVAKEYGKKEE